MKTLFDRIISYASTGLVFFSINVFIRRPDARLDIFYYIIIGLSIGFIMDYFIPSKIYAKPVLRYACPALVFNIIIFLWNIVLSKGYSFLSQPSYWYTMALLTIAYIFFSYLMHRKYIMEKKRIQHLLERKIQEMN